MKIYSRGGDRGETSLLGNRRVSKNHAQVEACGSLDELNACLGTVLADRPDEWLQAQLERIQRDLFALGSFLAAAGSVEAEAAVSPRVAEILDSQRVTELEQSIDRATEQSPPLSHFVLPGGTRTAAKLHLARTICRRAERRLIAMDKHADSPQALVYLNRLSDLLFALARRDNALAGHVEPTWP